MISKSQFIYVYRQLTHNFSPIVQNRNYISLEYRFAYLPRISDRAPLTAFIQLNE